MEKTGRYILGTIMGFAGLCFVLFVVAIFSAVVDVWASKTAKPTSFEDIAVSTGILFFLAALGQICLAFAWRCFRNEETEAGSFYSPWAIGLMGCVMLIGATVKAINEQKWLMLSYMLPILLSMIYLSFLLAYRKKAKSAD